MDIETDGYYQYGILWSQGMQDSIEFTVDTLIDLDSATAIFTIWASYTDTETIFLDTMQIGTHSVRTFISDSLTDTLSGTFPADVWIETSAGRKLQIWYKYISIETSSRGR